MVSVLAFYRDDPSSNSSKSTFFCNNLVEKKDTEVGPFKRKLTT